MRDGRHLAVFVAVADELHLGRAAERLGLPRTTLAARLRALEADLGLSLVDRRHRCRIALTQHGDALLAAARAAVDATTALDAMAGEVRDGRRNVVRVGLVTDSDHEMQEVVQAVRRSYDGCSIDVRHVSWTAARDAIAVGGLECVIGRGTDPILERPFVVDPRPDRTERCAHMTIGPARGRPIAVAWRRSWADDRRGEAFVVRMGWVRERILDRWSPRRAAARRARVRVAREREEAVTRDRTELERYGPEVAARRRRARERNRVRQRMHEAVADGQVGIHLCVAWLVHFGPDAQPPAPVGAQPRPAAPP